MEFRKRIVFKFIAAFIAVCCLSEWGFAKSKSKLSCVLQMIEQENRISKWDHSWTPYSQKKIKTPEVLMDPYVQHAMSSDEFREYLIRLSKVPGAPNIEYKDIADSLPRYDRKDGPIIPHIKKGNRYALPSELSQSELLKYILQNYDLNPINSSATALNEMKSQMRNVVHPLVRSGAVSDLPLIRSGVESVQSLWIELLRMTPNLTRGTLLPVPNAYVVAGGRFDETYFWDSFWIMKGLIQSGFGDLALGMFENWIHIFEKYGVISNGNRFYYLSRTQPPLLVEMMKLLWQNSLLKFDESTLKRKGSLEIRSLRAAQAYYKKIWLGTDRFSKEHGLFKYSDGIRGIEDDQSQPPGEHDVWIRPESSRLEEREREIFAKRVFAESGWDMSYSRFGMEPNNFLPVDLNSILRGYTSDLASILKAVGDTTGYHEFYNESERIQVQMDRYLFNTKIDLYSDYNVRTKELSRTYSAAQFFPFYFGVQTPRYKNRVVLMNLLKKLKLYSDLSLRTTSREGTGQWDGEWSWAPLVDIAFQSLLIHKLIKEANELAMDYSFMVLRSYYLNDRKFFEKYRSSDGSIKIPEHSEIYGNEVGFGWTNGVLIGFLNHLKAQGLLFELESRLASALK